VSGREGKNMSKQYFFAIVLLAATAGCDTMGSRNPVPENLVTQAEVPGFAGDRLLVEPQHIKIGQIDALLGSAVTRAEAVDTNQPLTELAISGGGSRGAYGAGLLCGWTEAGNRPEFDIVTGISTGALIAPYAFLGPAYDAQLKTAYTTTSDKDIFKKRSKLKILFGADAALDTTPLAKTIDQEINQALMDAIAAEHRKGRRFYVGTSDLDAQTLMIWDMGAIAASGRSGARQLFCEVLRASASIPVAFPPVLFQVEAGGRQYDEMHGDGGVMTQVFGAVFLEQLTKLSGHRNGRLFVIRNECMAPEWKAVKPRVLPIAGRTVGTLVKTQGMADLYWLYTVSQITGTDYNLASIPESFDVKAKTLFDPDYMKALFNFGYNQARNGTEWVKTPPLYKQMEQ
jgi:predicted patatin/cPLA2 family phospholipase